MFAFTEKWASVHPEILHIPGKDSPNKRFFLTTGFAAMTDFLQSRTAQSSPCVVMESSAPLSGNHGGFDYRDYTIYFCVRSPRQMQSMDGYEARDCRLYAERLARTFVNNAIAMNRTWRMRGESRHVEENYSIDPYGPFWNWWYAASLTVRVGEGQNSCLGEELLPLLQH